jgi:hypothetical protein
MKCAGLMQAVDAIVGRRMQIWEVRKTAENKNIIINID